MDENQQDIQIFFISFWKNKDVYAYIKVNNIDRSDESDENLKKTNHI